MSMTSRNFTAYNPYEGENIMQLFDLTKHLEERRAEPAQLSSIVVRRGAQLMIVFAGCPDDDTVRNLRRANVEIGVALAQGELASVKSLDDFGYAFVSVSSFGRSPLDQALRDLTTRNWVLDDDGDDGEAFDPASSAKPKAPVRPSERLAIPA
jgi:hypothetical protein